MKIIRPSRTKVIPITEPRLKEAFYHTAIAACCAVFMFFLLLWQCNETGRLRDQLNAIKAVPAREYKATVKTDQHLTWVAALGRLPIKSLRH